MSNGFLTVIFCNGGRCLSWLDVIMDGQWAEASVIDVGERLMIIFLFAVDSRDAVVYYNDDCSCKTGMTL